MNKVNANIYKLALFLGVILAYVVVNDVHVGFWVDTPHTSTAITIDSTPGKNIFNDDAHLDTSSVTDSRSNPNPSLTPDQTAAIVPCDTDLDCVIKNPQVIPDGYTIDEYLKVYGDAPQFPTIGDCSRVDWLSQDGDGGWFVPFDKNHDGAIDCSSDIELGA